MHKTFIENGLRKLFFTFKFSNKILLLKTVENDPPKSFLEFILKTFLNTWTIFQKKIF